MNSFEYASPTTETEALGFLNDSSTRTALLAGGTDLVSLLKSDVVSPQRVVDLKNIDSLSGVEKTDDGISIGALTTLEDMQMHPLVKDYTSLLDIIDETRSIQLQSTGTLGGDLCHLPNCWYYRNGYGILGMENGTSLVEEGDNRYHAILGNQGPAKFVNASRFAPALMSYDAQLRILGPDKNREEIVPISSFYISPKTNRQGNTILKPGQFVSHVLIPNTRGIHSASYEMMQMEGLDWPLGAAAVCLELNGHVVRNVRMTMGHVAPIPWVAEEASRFLVGRDLDESSAERAGEIAVANATPLSMNDYKVQIAKTVVKRALLKSASLLEEGL